MDDTQPGQQGGVNLALVLVVSLLLGFVGGFLFGQNGPAAAGVATTVINRCPHTLDLEDQYILAGFKCPNPADQVPLNGCHCMLAHQIMDRVKDELGQGKSGSEIRREIETEYGSRLQM
ncbi:MAG TPA: hypothetical protein VGB22_06220 [candidate division Zixibacteria bacterium]|jgi:hypothetical protein